ncbi:hypothetical protein FACS1894159_02640 [Bacteroidia bacterium]|nr:hypothetical protein FACS1894159_02640 [Bacteroidia bacterium]
MSVVFDPQTAASFKATVAIFPTDFSAKPNTMKIAVPARDADGYVHRYRTTKLFDTKLERAIRYRIAVDMNAMTIDPLSEPNTYVVASGSYVSLNIPVGKVVAWWVSPTYVPDPADRVDLSGADLPAGVIWQDAQNVVSSVAVVGSGSTATVQVATSGVEGNAVISLKDAGGVYRWTWMVWVPDYNPDAIRATQSATPTTAANSGWTVAGGKVYRFVDSNDTDHGGSGSYGGSYDSGVQYP